MQINITSLIKSPAFVPFDMSNNAATLGNDAGKLTWSASVECARDSETPNLLDTEEKKNSFRSFVRSSGGWSQEEIEAWDDTELYTLFLQWIAGDIRECFGDADFEQWDWAEYEKDAQAGQIPSRLFLADRGPNKGDLFFDISA